MAANTVRVKIEVDAERYERAVLEACVEVLVATGMDHDEAVQRVTGQIAARRTATHACLCPLLNVTRIDEAEPRYRRGDPRGTGCPLHETDEMRAQDQAARDRARYGDQREERP